MTGPRESTENGLTRVTVNLTRQAVADLDHLVDAFGCNRTDAVNRAISLAALFRELGDGRSLRVVGPDGAVERIHVI